jgi:hypothetical protein
MILKGALPVKGHAVERPVSTGCGVTIPVTYPAVTINEKEALSRS